MMSTGAEKLVPPAVDTLPVNLAILDDKGEILLANRAWQEFGRANENAIRPETLGVNYLEVTEQADDDTAQTIAAGLRDLISGEQDLLEVEYPCHSPTEQRWFLIRAAPFTIGEACYISVAHLDITNRVLAERAARRFERVVETAGHAIFLTDPDGTITYINPAFEDITGYGPKAAIGQTPRILKSGETPSEVYTNLWETITAGEVWEGVLLNRRKSRELYYAQQTVAPVLNEHGQITEFIAIQTDITTLKENQNLLEKLGTLLRHDVRNQLNIIQGRTDLLQHGDDDVAQTAAAIAKAVDHLLSVTEHAHELTAFLSSTTSPKPRNIAAIARNVVTTEQAQHPDATLTVDAPDEVVALCVEKLETALRELVQNGIFHNDTETPHITITIREDPDWVEIHVTDNGAGIPEAEHITLDSDEISQLYHDTGAGLNLVYWVVRRSGGQLHFAENDPRGTDVIIKLPKPR